MEMFEPVERGFNSGALVSPEKVDVTIFDFNEIADSYNKSIGKDLMSGAEMSALFDAFIDMKTAAKASGMNEGGVSLSAADIEKAKQDAEKITALKKQKTDERLDKLDYKLWKASRFCKKLYQQPTTPKSNISKIP